MLIHAYSYYGHYDSAIDLFTEGNNTEEAGLTVHQWAVIINACGKFKKGREALVFFNQMISNGTQSNDVVLGSILFACSHSGLVDEAIDILLSMKDKFGVEPDTKHLTCVVDALGRAGRLSQSPSLSLPLSFSLSSRSSPYGI